MLHHGFVYRQAQTLADGVHLDLPPKSEAGYRTVPLAEPLSRSSPPT